MNINGGSHTIFRLPTSGHDDPYLRPSPNRAVINWRGQIAGLFFLEILSAEDGSVCRGPPPFRTDAVNLFEGTPHRDRHSREATLRETNGRGRSGPRVLCSRGTGFHKKSGQTRGRRAATRNLLAVVAPVKRRGLFPRWPVGKIAHRVRTGPPTISGGAVIGISPFIFVHATSRAMMSPGNAC